MIETLKDVDVMVDLRVRTKYFAIFKKTFNQLVRNDKLKAMEKFYHLYGAVSFQKLYDVSENRNFTPVLRVFALLQYSVDSVCFSV